MRLKEGSIVAGHLRLVRPVKRGGMGEVWAAYNEALKTEVAVKFITGEDVASARARARFEREAEIAAKLKSPHVAHTYDHGCLDDGTPYIIMELLEGETLGERLRRSPLSMAEMSAVLKQAAKALSKAHKLGIVHRDVKPANLFLIDDDDDEPFVKLLDFGVAKCSAAGDETKLTQMGHLLGSPLYMGPEQFAEAMSVDSQADLWSLAVTTYQCLASRPPFRGESTGAILTAVVTRRYEPITKLRSDLPAELDQWFAKAFHREVGSRHKSVREMAGSFAAIAGQHGGTQSVGAEPRPAAELVGEKEVLTQEGTLVMIDNATIDLPTGWRAGAVNLPYGKAAADEDEPSAAAGTPPSGAASSPAAGAPPSGAVPSPAAGAPPSGAVPSPAAGAPPSGAVPSPAASGEPLAHAEKPLAGQDDSTAATAARPKETNGGARRLVIAAMAAVCIGLIGILVVLETGSAQEPPPVVAPSPDDAALPDMSEANGATAQSGEPHGPDERPQEEPPPPASSGPDEAAPPSAPVRTAPPRLRVPRPTRSKPVDIYE